MRASSLPTPEPTPPADVESAPPDTGTRPLAAAVRWLGTLGLLAIVAAVVDLEALWPKLRGLALPWLLAALALSVPMYLLSAWRWWYIARRIDAPIRYTQALADYYLSTLLNQTMPIGIAGDAVRAVRHARRLQRTRPGSGYGPAVRALLLERFSGALVFAMVVLAVAASLAGSHPDIALVACGIVAAAAVIATLGMALAARRQGRGPVARLVSDGRRALLHGGSLFVHTGLSSAILAALIAMFYCAGRAADVTMDWLAVAQIAPLILAATWLPWSFAGWGAREAVAAALFGAMGLNITEGVAVSVTFGLFNLVVATPGLMVLLWPGRGTVAATCTVTDAATDAATDVATASRPDRLVDEVTDPAATDAPAARLPLRAVIWPAWMALASIVAAYAAEARYFAIAASLAFVAWAVSRWREWAAGPANWLTLCRVVLTASLAWSIPRLDRPFVVALIITCFVMDGVDGWLARKTGTASALGAEYDMESDAFLVTSLCLLLHTGGLVGIFGLIAGWWRYAYAMIIVFLPSAGEAPRSQIARYIYATLVVSLVTAFAFPSIAVPTIIIGTVLVSYSFCRSLLWSFRLRTTH